MISTNRLSQIAGLSLAFAGCLLSGPIGCYGDGHQEPRTIGAAVIPLALPDELGQQPPEYEDLRRAPVEFDHDLHTKKLADKGCQVCHPAREADRPSLLFKRKENGSNRDALMELYHNECIECHKETATKDPREFCTKECKGRPKETAEKIPEKKCLQACIGRRKAIPVACGECHVERYEPLSARRGLAFDYSLHHRHSSAFDDKCESCHHVYDENQKKLVYKKNAESACRDCHGDRDEGNTPSLRKASHEDCIACHMDRAGKKQKSGPVDCSGCHDAKRQKNFQRTEDPPRLKRGQPDVNWIFTEEARAPVVLFSHKLHEEVTTSCSECHHKTLKACKECHKLSGDGKESAVTLEQAYHSAASKHSCVGCHKARTKQRACAGCHTVDDKPPSEGSCVVCHKGPTLPVGEEGMPEPVHTLATPVGLPAVSDGFPETVLIDHLVKQYKPSTLPHRKIVFSLQEDLRQNRLASAFHREGVLCADCHHRSPTGMRPSPCRACHDQDGHPTEDKPGLFTAYHRQCLGCHQDMALKQVGCEDCHPKASGEETK